MPWFEKYKDRFELELASLKEAGIEYHIDEKQRANGAARSNLVTAIAGILGNALINTSAMPLDASKANQVFQAGATEATGINGNGADESDRPFAYVYYLLYDKEFTLITAGWDRVSSIGGFDVGMEAFSVHENLVIPQITISEPGYMYVFVTNESENTEVWFDDLTITNQRAIVVAGSDYYPFGLPMAERQITREEYRYGYQGQFSEENKATGWNEFQLRMYDARIARWISTDPQNQFASPYVAMGNNPSNSVDPNGGWVIFANKLEALRVAADINAVFRARFGLDYDVIQVVDQKVQGQSEMGGKLKTNSKFNWDMSEHTQALFDVINVKDHWLWGDITGTRRDMDLASMGTSPDSRHFFLHEDLPTYPHGQDLTLGMVGIHEMTYHHHGEYAVWLSGRIIKVFNAEGQLIDKIKSSNIGYHYFHPYGKPHNPNGTISKHGGGAPQPHDPSRHTFIGSIVAQSLSLATSRGAAFGIRRLPRYLGSWVP